MISHGSSPLYHYHHRHPITKLSDGLRSERRAVVLGQAVPGDNNTNNNNKGNNNGDGKNQSNNVNN